MSERDSRPRGRELLDEWVSESLLRIVSESLSASWASAEDENGVWNRSGSRRASERTLEDLTRARELSRRLLEGWRYDDGNEFAIGAAENRVNYVVGEAGLKYEAVPAKGQQPASELIAEAQVFIDTFCELNNLPEIEAETLWRADRDGEAFLRLYETGSVPEVDFIEPERVRPPASSLARAGEIATDPAYSARWGILRRKDNRRHIVAYYVDETTERGEIGEPVEVPEAEVCHLKFNVTSEFERGWPTWEPVRRSLIRAEELLVAMTASGKARAKIAIVTEIPGWGQQKADQLHARLTTKPQHQPSGEQPREQSVEELPYGAHLRVRDGTKVNFPPSNLGASDTVEAIQANLRTAGQRLNMPEWMFSGMADQKYSNAFVVEAPSLRMFKSVQSKLAQFFGGGRFRQQASVIWRAMRIAAARGILNPAVLTAVQIKVTAPSLETRDKSSEASANSTYIDKQVKSRETCMEEQGLDPEREKARIEAETKLYGLAGKRSELLGGEEPPGGAPDLARAGEIPTAEALRHFVEKWIAEGGAVDSGSTFPDSEHFGLTAEGEPWISEALYAAFVSEANRDLSKLKKEKREITRNGKTYTTTVYVRADKGSGLSTQPKGDSGSPDAEVKNRTMFGAAVAEVGERGTEDHREIAVQRGQHNGKDVYRWALRRGGNYQNPELAGPWQPSHDSALAGANRMADESGLSDKSPAPAVKAPVKREVNLGQPPLPKSQAQVNVPTLYKGEADKQIAKVFGGKDESANNAALSASVGMPDDAQVTVTLAGKFEKKFSDDAPKKGAEGVRVEVSHPNLGRVSRFVGTDGKGKRFIRNEILEVNKDKQGGGTGTEIFRKQVESASAEGVDYIETHAVGKWGTSYNGYYTWPQFGYNAPIPRGKNGEKVRAVLPGAKSIQDVMDAPRVELPPEEVKRISDELNRFDAKRGKPAKERTSITGAEWWKVNGNELKGMKFDLRPGSRSMKKFAAYLKASQKPATQTPTPAPPT